MTHVFLSFQNVASLHEACVFSAEVLLANSCLVLAWTLSDVDFITRYDVRTYWKLMKPLETWFLIQEVPIQVKDRSRIARTRKHNVTKNKCCDNFYTCSSVNTDNFLLYFQWQRFKPKITTRIKNMPGSVRWFLLQFVVRWEKCFLFFPLSPSPVSSVAACLALVVWLKSSNRLLGLRESRNRNHPIRQSVLPKCKQPKRTVKLETSLIS